MKRIFVLITALLTLCFTLFLTSCDYQESVDSARADLMESAKELLDPFLNQTKSSQVSSNATADNVDDVDGKNNATQSLPSSDDVKSDH